MNVQENNAILDCFKAAIQATRELSERLLSTSGSIPKVSMNVSTAIRCLDQALVQHKSLVVVKDEPVSKSAESVLSEVPEEGKSKKRQKKESVVDIDSEEKKDDEESATEDVS
ncbi:MAG: hypothetical protein WC477_06805 [Patescibacteria group bacterium]